MRRLLLLTLLLAPVADAHAQQTVTTRDIVELTKAGIPLRRKALKIPNAVVERLGVGLDELEHLHTVLTRINGAALAAGALEVGSAREEQRGIRS